MSDSIETNRELCTAFFDNSVRCGAVIFIAAEPCDAISETLRGFLDDVHGDRIDALLGPLPDWMKEQLAEVDGWQVWEDDLSQHLFRTGRLGVLMRAESPVYQYTSPSSANFSWGHYRTEWVYGDTIIDAARAALAWADAQAEKDKAKAGY